MGGHRRVHGEATRGGGKVRTRWHGHFVTTCGCCHLEPGSSRFAPNRAPFSAVSLLIRCSRQYIRRGPSHFGRVPLNFSVRRTAATAGRVLDPRHRRRSGRAAGTRHNSARRPRRGASETWCRGGPAPPPAVHRRLAAGGKRGRFAAGGAGGPARPGSRRLRPFRSSTAVALGGCLGSGSSARAENMRFALSSTAAPPHQHNLSSVLYHLVSSPPHLALLLVLSVCTVCLPCQSRGRRNWLTT